MKRLAGLAVVVALALAGCTSADGIADNPPDGTTYNTDAFTVYSPEQRQAPDDWQSTSETGEAVASGDYDGQVVVLNFWYAACAPCRVEAPMLESLSEKYADDGVQFLGVNVRDKADTAAGFTREFAVGYPSLLDADTGNIQFAFANASPVTATPTTIVVGADGKVTARILGQLDGESLLDTFIGDALAEAD